MGGGLRWFGGGCTEQDGGPTGNHAIIFACNYFRIAIIFALQLFLHWLAGWAVGWLAGWLASMVC